VRRFVPVVIIALIVAVAWLALGETDPPAEPLGELPVPLSDADAEGAGVSLVAQGADPGIRAIGARWYFNWYFRPHEGIDLPFTPLVCGYPGNRQVTDEHIAEVERAIRGNPSDYPDRTVFLLGNEIGYTHQKDGRTAAQYAEDFERCSTMLRAINPSFRISTGPAILTTDPGITGAIVGAQDGLDYLGQVIDAYRERYGTAIPADFIAATNHVLEATPAALDEFEQRLFDLRRLLAERGLRDRGVILTEYGVPTRGASPAEIERFLGEATRIVATATDPSIGHPADGRLVQRYAWFTARPLSRLDKLRSLGFGAFFLQLAQTSLFDDDGDRTHLGHVYDALLGTN
jgi:hypothetical protein